MSRLKKEIRDAEEIVLKSKVRLEDLVELLSQLRIETTKASLGWQSRK